MNSPFPKGDTNPVSMYFTGKSYLRALSEDQVQIFNVTFTPGCRNFWHIHHADQGGGQVLLCTYGRGWYQQWGCDPRELHPGDVVNIPAGVKHWHGAAKDSEFAHIAIEVPGEGYRTQWCEPVTDAEYDRLP